MMSHPQRAIFWVCPNMSELTHLDAKGAARMVDVGDKEITTRIAIASGAISMQQSTLQAIMAGDLKKGDVLGTARIAGIMAAKRTHELIPLCHPLALNKVQVDLVEDQSLPGIRVTAEVRNSGKTGVEMEALTAASVACLTVYDMAKALEKAMVISDIKLEAKSGGKSGDYQAVEP